MIFGLDYPTVGALIIAIASVILFFVREWIVEPERMDRMHRERIQEIGYHDRLFKLKEKMKVHGQLLFYISIIQKGLPHVKRISLPKNVKGTEIGEKHDCGELVPFTKLLTENFDLLEKGIRDLWLVIHHHKLIKNDQMNINLNVLWLFDKIVDDYVRFQKEYDKIERQ